MNEETRPHRVATDVLYERGPYRLEVQHVASGDRVAERVTLHAPAVVHLLPVTPTKQLIVLRQYRHPFDAEILEFPAGGIDPGETPAQAAQRELREETGLAAGKLIQLGHAGLLTSPGLMDERATFFVALDCVPTGDSHENIEWQEIPVGTALALLGQPYTHIGNEPPGDDFLSMATKTILDVKSTLLLLAARYAGLI